MDYDEQEFDLQKTPGRSEMETERLIRLASRAKGVSPEGVTGYEVFRWAEEGDEEVLWALDKFARDIAFIIINLQAVFDPERFAIGGGISKQPLLLKYIQRNLDGFYATTRFPIPKPEIVTCKYYNDANLIGALGHFLNQYPA